MRGIGYGVLLGVVAFTLVVRTVGASSEDEVAAVEAANRWLALVDSGQYAASWKNATSGWPR